MKKSVLALLLTVAGATSTAEGAPIQAPQTLDLG